MLNVLKGVILPSQGRKNNNKTMSGDTEAFAPGMECND
jgi:hypothetical protein